MNWRVAVGVFGLVTLCSEAALACGAYPAGSNAFDAVISMVADGSNLVSFSSQGGVPTTRAGILTYNRTSNALLLCDGVSWKTVSLSGSTAAAGSAGQVQFNASGALAADAGLYWDNTNKRLGIGTTSPAYTLDVTGTTRTTGNYFTNGSLYMGQDGTSTSLIGSSASNQFMYLYGASSKATGAAIVLYGRGYGAVEGRVAYYASTNTNDTSVSHLFAKVSAGGTDTTLASIRSNGNMYVFGDYTCAIGTATTVSCSSDRRLKTAIEPIHGALDSVVRLQGVTYRLKDPKKNQRERVGLIAQDVQKVFPQVVSLEDNGYYTMDYGSLVAPIIEAVKELKAANDNLNSENAELRHALDDLRSRVDKLEYVK